MVYTIAQNLYYTARRDRWDKLNAVLKSILEKKNRRKRKKLV